MITLAASSARLRSVTTWVLYPAAKVFGEPRTTWYRGSVPVKPLTKLFVWRHSTSSLPDHVPVNVVSVRPSCGGHTCLMIDDADSIVAMIRGT
ncbi:hypothetical protein J6590_038018 [Homalodisca vitripennis]|nr:hypothetical protein J6590_038018 [Homalodisca vitripennis]